MKNRDSLFWIPVTLESEEAESTVRKAISACMSVHDWSMGMLRVQWLIDSSYRVKTGDLMPELTPLLDVHKIRHLAQRFAYLTTVSRAIARFYQEIVIDQVGSTGAEVIFPPHKPPPCYHLLDVQSRSVWRKYMTEHDRISTHYGAMFLEGEWRKTLLEQAVNMRITPSLIPYLMYSFTLREGERGWEGCFNLHQPDSRYGKDKVKQSWETVHEKLDTVRSG